jgi:hypothetical protein
MDVSRAAWLFCAPEALRRAAFAVLALGSMIFVLRRREKLPAVPSV